MRSSFLVLALAVSVIFMCGGGKKESEAKVNAVPVVHASLISGMIEETMDVSNYTYIRVNTPGGEVWAAGPKTVVQVGEMVSFEGSTLMKDFRSPTLERTFPEIFFTNQIISGVHGPNCNH